MATTYKSLQAEAGVQPHAGIGPHEAYAEFDLALAVGSGGSGGTALVVNDVIEMIKIPKDARILDVLLSSDDLDTDGTPAIILDVGDTDGTPDPDRYIDGATVGQAGGLQGMNNKAGHLYQFTANGTLNVLVETAPDVGTTTGKIKLSARYTMAQK